MTEGKTQIIVFSPSLLLKYVYVYVAAVIRQTRQETILYIIKQLSGYCCESLLINRSCHVVRSLAHASLLSS